MIKTYVYDVECYVNYFLVRFEEVSTKEVIEFEMRDSDDVLTSNQKKELYSLFVNHTCVGFNSNGYDLPMCWLALCGFKVSRLKQWSDKIIVENVLSWQICEMANVKKMPTFRGHIDIQPMVKLQPSLKICAGRLFAPKMQDLPYPPDSILTEVQKDNVNKYNFNDLDVTKRLLARLQTELELRVEMSKDYEIDVRSKSDAQIAEAVIKREIEKTIDGKVFKPQFNRNYAFTYNPPSYLKFKNPQLNSIFEKLKTHIFTLNDKGSVELPSFVKTPIIIDGNKYQMGIGGLHSCEKSISHYSDDNIKLIDFDVASYYPALIINSGLYPKHLGDTFIDVYSHIRSRRLTAKSQSSDYYKVGRLDKAEEFKIIADSLKIVLNGTFGKTGSRHSIFYSPDLLISVTVTGQLALLMQIDRNAQDGIKAVSANTDGVVYKIENSQESKLLANLKQWELDTGFDLERTDYKSIHNRDVNTYFAITDNGKIKSKTYYEMNEKIIDIDHNPEWAICTKAVSEFLKNGTSIVDTVNSCHDIRYFVKVTKAMGGGVIKHKTSKPIPFHDTPEQFILKQGFEALPRNLDNKRESQKYQRGNQKGGIKLCYRLAQEDYTEFEEIGDYLGKVVRFYKAKNSQTYIMGLTHNSKIPESDGCKPLMDMPSAIPSDLDREWYIQNSYAILKETGVDIERHEVKKSKEICVNTIDLLLELAA